MWTGTPTQTWLTMAWVVLQCLPELSIAPENQHLYREHCFLSNCFILDGDLRPVVGT